MTASAPHTTAPEAKEVFVELIERVPSDQWDARLTELCGGDEALRRRVEGLLRAHREAGSFLEPAATSIAIESALNTVNHLPEPPGTQIGPYTLLHVIGEGGMGVVYLADQRVPVERRVALKIIKPGMDSRQVIARFEAERQALALMDHPNIARVLDAGTTQSARPYFVMELVRGVPITQYCDERQLSLRQRLELFVPVCQAVQHAHQKGVIHRDLKPSNVLVAEYDQRPVPKVIDFGLAKATAQGPTEQTMFTQLGQVVGTLEYMSPEQAKLNQLDIDTRTDVYSLGVLLYELLAGSTPFDAKRLRKAAFDEMLRIIREEEPARPSTKLSSSENLPSIAAQRHSEPAKLTRLVRGELDWIVMKSLEKDRNRRYETANGLALDVTRYLQDEPVQACPPSAAYRFRKFARRNMAALATASLIGLAVLVSVVVLAVSNVLIRQETSAKEQALGESQTNLREAKRQERIAKANAKHAAEQTVIAEANAKAAKTQEQLAKRRYYAAQLNLAMQAWRDGETPRVLELLEGQRPRPDEEDLRGFEWFYLWRLCQSGCRVPIHGHDRATLGVAFSPDGQTLASASWDWTVRLWDTVTGKELNVLRGNQGPWEVAFSPDGKMLVSSGQEAGSMILWDVATGKPLHTIAGSVEGARFTHDGKSVVGSQYTGKRIDNTGSISDLMAWDVASGKERVLIPGAGILSGFAPAHGTVVTLAGRYSPNGEVRVWDWPSGKRRLTIPAEAVRVALSPDGSRVAATTRGAIKLWDAKTGDLLHTIPTDEIARGLAFSPDGKRLASGLENRRVIVFDAQTGNRIAEDVHLDPVWGLAFSPDGELLASGSLSGAIKLWDMAPAQEATTITIPGPHCGQFAQDGKTLLIGNRESTRIIDVSTGKEIGLLPVSNVLAISGDATRLAARKSKDDYLVWDVPSGREVAEIAFPQTTDVPSRVALSRDGNQLACFTPWRGHSTVTVWDVANKQSTVLKAPKEHNELSVICAEFSPDGKLLAAGFQFQLVVVWDLTTQEVKRTIYQQPSMMVVYSLAFSPDSKSLAIGTDGGAVTLWDLDAGQQRVAFRGHTYIVHALAFALDGTTLATAGQDKTVRLWDVITGQERSTLTGHVQMVGGVVFSPDGFTLATGSGDGAVKLWRGANDALALAPRKAIARSRPAAPFKLPNGAIELTEEGLREGIHRLPELLPLRMQLAERLRQENKFAESAEVLRDAIRLNPAWLHGYMQLAEDLRHAKKIGEAVELMRQAVARDPGNALLHESLGWALWEDQKYADAELAFRDAVRLVPGMAPAQIGLGIALQGQRRFEESIDPLRIAMRLNPDHRHTLGSLGGALNELHRHAEAEEVLQKLVRLAPDDAEAHHGLSWAFLGQKKFVEAEASSREALRLAPQHRFAPQVLADALMEQGKAAEAHSLLAEMVQREPENTEWLARIGHVLRIQKRWAEAEMAFNKALQVDPERPGMHNALGWLLWEQGKFAEAESAFHEAVRLAPTDPGFHMALGSTLVEQNKLAEAEAAYRKAIRLAPENGEGRYGLGRALVEQKRFAEAETSLREALRLDPKHHWAPGLLKRALDGQNIRDPAPRTGAEQLPAAFESEQHRSEEAHP